MPTCFLKGIDCNVLGTALRAQCVQNPYGRKAVSKTDFERALCTYAPQESMEQCTLSHADPDGGIDSDRCSTLCPRKLILRIHELQNVKRRRMKNICKPLESPCVFCH